MWAPRRRFRPSWGDVSENKRFTYQPALDGLRAFAVLSVFAYHLDAGWARGGFLGVDTFFVLSGFLITSLLVGEWARRGGISFAGFWARRARRLLPAEVSREPAHRAQHHPPARDAEQGQRRAGLTVAPKAHP